MDWKKKDTASVNVSKEKNVDEIEIIKDGPKEYILKDNAPADTKGKKKSTGKAPEVTAAKLKKEAEAAIPEVMPKTKTQSKASIKAKEEEKNRKEKKRVGDSIQSYHDLLEAEEERIFGDNVDTLHKTRYATVGASKRVFAC